MFLATSLKRLNRKDLATVAFYGISGLLLLIALPFSAYAPHLAFIGIISVITAYSLLTKRGWALWLVGVLLVINSVFSLYTLLSVGFSNIIVALSMVGLLAFTWIASIYLLVLKRRS